MSGGFGFAEFLSAVSGQTGRSVVDRSGLSGKWIALQEQLGLKLESAQGPVQVFAIDRVERPTTD